MSQPRSSGMTRSFFVRTSWIGTFEPVANFVGLLTIRSLCSPANTDLGVVAEHETVRRRLHGHPVNADVLAQQAVGDPAMVREIADDTAFQHDAVLDFRVPDLGAWTDRRERADIGV